MADTTRQTLDGIRQSLTARKQKAQQNFAEFRASPEPAVNAPTRFSYVNSLQETVLNKDKLREILQSLGEKRQLAEENAVALMDTSTGLLIPGQTPASPPQRNPAKVLS